MLQQYDSEIDKRWEIKFYCAEEVAELGKLSKTLRQFYHEEPDLNEIYEWIIKINKEHGTKFDSIEFIETEERVKRYTITK